MKFLMNSSSHDARTRNSFDEFCNQLKRSLKNFISTYPCNSIVVDVIENRQARLRGLIDVELGVVWLRDFLVAGLRPWIVTESDWIAVGWLDLLAIS